MYINSLFYIFILYYITVIKAFLGFRPFTYKGIGHPPVRPAVCGFPVTRCDHRSLYRRFDGSCTNPANPTLGMAGAPYINLLTPKYQDGTRAPTTMTKEKPLPFARTVKNSLFPDGANLTSDGNVIFVSFGQFLAHDISRMLEPPHELSCCDKSGQHKSNAHPSCFPIDIPENDRIFKSEGKRCLNFTRAQTDMDFGCRSGGNYARQLNAVSSALDLSVIYGSSKDTSISLRSFCNGLSKTERRNGTELPPTKSPLVPNCKYSFITGDDRSNQNAALMAIHAMFLKEHNKMASSLASMNPHWDDDRLFYEARRILVAQFQYIAYYEWLPLIIARDALLDYGIIHESSGHVNDYNPNVDPGPSNEYAHSAFIYFHSIIPEFFELRNKDQKITTLDWANSIFCLDILLNNGILEQLYRGMLLQRMAEVDERFAESVSQKFDKQRNNQFGNDLRSIDLQRGRDVGLASYYEYRLLCGAPTSTSFRDFEDVIRPQDVNKLESLYDSFDTVELSSAASLETHVSGSKVGPIFECVIADQFLRTRVGDYLWFEHSSAGFTTEQLSNIKQSSISRIMCNSADGVTIIQPSGFVPPNNENVVTDCANIPNMDMNVWREPR